MTDAHKIAALVLAAVLATCSPVPAMAAGGANGGALPADTAHSSAAGTYGGQGHQITPISGEPSSSGALPFTGLDLGLLVAAAAVLSGLGLLLRWRVQRGEQRSGD